VLVRLDHGADCIVPSLTFPPNNPTRARGTFHGRFYGRLKFLLQNGAIRRNATQISLATVTSEKHAVQHPEKLRKPFSLN
jgi:hypothetical protein